MVYCDGFVLVLFADWCCWLFNWWGCLCCGFSCCGNAFVLGFGGCFVFDLIGELLVYWFGLLLVEWWFSLGFVSFCYLLVGWLVA